MHSYLVSHKRFPQADTTWIQRCAAVSEASRKVHKVEIIVRFQSSLFILDISIQSQNEHQVWSYNYGSLSILNEFQRVSKLTNILIRLWMILRRFL